MEVSHGILQDLALPLVKGTVLSAPWKTLFIYLNTTNGKTREITLTIINRK